mgnify:CR=1 FL=1
MSNEPRIIECPRCDSKVSAKVLASREYEPEEFFGDMYEMLFLECPVCHETMLGRAELEQVGEAKYFGGGQVVTHLAAGS